ncbi:ArsR/SmtB family transcription factor [Desulfallas thermosapovorans]|uniref:DNA-binding transcriptional ArsR family regulator n=1 Tax=Desulfallas thermosapovorans DSM 6562 TaxID=1121431 RepID=A0A5S4ZQZ3_9FIRM|nr:metalloregulator ArsR/SmtB family transcription factor [Desulfallas thermosapovorans]TYO94429.1 DNA-binding transcriptional ArsR family regulator [Desulfallas thermosapovorans DSM 6562]
MGDVLDFLKILADDTRLKIIMMLSRRDMCVCEIIDELAMSQPAVSHHLRILRKSGIVNDDKDGRWVFYSLNEKVFNQRLAAINNDLFSQIEENLKNRQSNRDYDACLRMENEMCSCLEVNKSK